MQLIVLGMHRSGTSSVTRLLNLAGAYFGAEGIATDPNEENPKGFWERRDVRAVCDGLLHDSGFDWWKVAGFDPSLVPDEVREEHLATFRRIVFELDAHRPWVMKEPRLSLLLPILRPALEAPVFVHVSREPIEIAESLAQRNGFPVPAGLALWEAYTVGALRASDGEPRVQLAYGDLLADPVATTGALVDSLTALGVQGLRMPTEREVLAFISPSLHRQRAGASRRGGQLNATQAKLARALDEARWPARRALAVSEGGEATLRAFEASEAVVVRVAELEDDLRAADAARAELVEAHRRGLEELLEAGRLREDEHRAELARRDAAADELAAVQRRAAESLEMATRRVAAVRTSGPVRFGSRISRLRDALRGHGTGGADAALESALTHIDRGRRALDREPEVDRSFAAGPGVPPGPPVEQLRRARATARAAGARTKVAVLAWDVGHNPFGRAHLLADLLRDRFDVEMWGTQFDRYGSAVWRPLRQTSIPVRRLPGGTFPDYLATLEDAAARIDADVLYVSKPRLPALALGVLAKQRWNRPLVVDIDDFEPSFFEEEEPLDLDEVLRRAQDPDAELPFGRLWTRACEGVVRAADQITVSNPELEARYGGVVVPHARDEAIFDPARFDRAELRRRMGLDEDDRLLLFGGTPRAHKGIIELLAALDRLADDHLRVGVFDTRELAELGKEIGDLRRWVLPLPSPSFEELPGLLAAADVSCALQAPGHPVSRYQMPAKVTDAMAMALPCLVTPVLPLQPLLDKDILEVFDGDVTLDERIRAIFDDPDASAERARRGREVFLESYSYAAVRPVIADAVTRHLDDPPPVATPLASLTGTVERVVRPGAAAVRRPKRRLDPGTTYDLLVLWKQNDTGIYGRRQDMFLEYLERSGRFGTIVHFDQPMSAERLLVTVRAGLRSTDQNRLVAGETLRRIAHRRDRGIRRQRTFIYAGGRRSRVLGFPRRQDFADHVRQVVAKEFGGRRPVLLWAYPTNEFLPDVIDAVEPDVVVADVVDDNRTWYEPGSPRRHELERNYADVLARSDLVLANCEEVAESMRAFADRVELVPNACELPTTTARRTPAELAAITGPVIGYAGNLSDRVDLPLLRQLVEARRDWTFVLLGSTHLDRSALVLADEPNVVFLGTRRYEEAQDLIARFDVALIPHLDNPMTRSMNPLKAYVYCSLGVPIVATPVANLDELAEHITVAEGVDGFVRAIDAALVAGKRAPDAAELWPHSWNERVERVLRWVDELAASRPEQPA
jgi:glycosyltransferase involved in cell wall biosynthesis